MNPSNRSNGNEPDRSVPELTSMLGARGDGVSIVGNLADRAIARDRRNRRREVGAGLVAGALALAIAVPIGWSALGPTHANQVPAGTSSSTVLEETRTSVPTTAATSPSTGAPSNTPPPSTGSVPPPTTPRTIHATGIRSANSLDFASGAATAVTDVGHIVNGVFQQGTTRIQLPDTMARSQLVLRLGEGVLVEDGTKVVLVGRDGRVIKRIDAYPGEARVSSARSHALLKRLDGTLLYIDASGAVVKSVKIPGEVPQLVGLVGTKAYASTTRRTIVWDVESGQTSTIPRPMNLVNEQSNLGLSTLEPTDPGDGDTYCQELVRLDTLAVVWRLCGPLHWDRFSPDGEYLIGGVVLHGLDPARTTKTDYATLVVMQTTDLDVVLNSGGTVALGSGARMGADHSLTVEVNRPDGQRELQRCTLDGACVVVGAAEARWADIPEGDDPYVMSDN